MKPAVGSFGAEGSTESAITERERFAPFTDPIPATGAVERRLQAKEGLPSFGLTGPSDNGPIENLLNVLASHAGRIGLQVPDEVKEGLLRAWREHRPRTPDDPTSLRRFVRIRAEFIVERGAADGDRVLTAESHHESGPLQVRIGCPSEHVRPRFDQTDGKITATCFGISQWREDKRVLEIHPVSVHTS